jgi:hypothetical protein
MRRARPLTVEVAPGRPRLAWHAAPGEPRPPHRAAVVERVAPSEGELAGRLILAGDNLEALHALAAEGAARSTSSTSTRRSWPGDRVIGAGIRWPIATPGPAASTATSTCCARGCWPCDRCWRRPANLFVHLDWHAVHYAKVLLDEIFGAGELPQRDRVAPAPTRTATRRASA